MGETAPLTLRYPLLALAVGDLLFLALRLRPWSSIGRLPGQGTTGYDPAICLAAYIGLIFWISGNRHFWIRKALSLGTLFGVPAGLLLMAHVLLTPGAGMASLVAHMAMLVSACILWAVAGFRSARAADHFGIGLVSGTWSAMVSALMACAATLARIGLRALPAQDLSTWTRHEVLSFGNPAMQSLVRNLVMITGFLLVCPLIGGALGMICGLGQEKR